MTRRSLPKANAHLDARPPFAAQDKAGWATVNYFVFDAPNVPGGFEQRMAAAKKRLPDGEMTPDQALRGKFVGRVAALPQVVCQGLQHLDELGRAREVIPSVTGAVCRLPVGELVAVVGAIVVRGLDREGGQLGFGRRSRGDSGLLS